MEVSRKLSRCFKKVSFAWHSSQLPEQKEGLFEYPKVKLNNKEETSQDKSRVEIK